MKKSYAVCCLTLVTAMLFTTLPLKAQQLTPFEVANEVMTYQQTAVLSSIGRALGPDPASPLNYSTFVDPAGQNFNFSLNAGTTYLGKAITLTTSGTLDSFGVWNVSSSGVYDGIPFALNSKYVPPTASPGSATHPAPNEIDPPVLYGSGYNPNIFCCTFSPQITICTTNTYALQEDNSLTDAEVCETYDLPGDTPSGIPTQYTYSNAQGPTTCNNCLVWGSNTWSTLCCIEEATGTSFMIGAPGTSASFITPVSLSTNTYFSDLGSGASTYQCCTGWPVSGSGASGGSFTSASQFTAVASGGVSRIDVGIGWVSGPNSFYASVWTSNGGLPGTQLARWDNLSSNLSSGLCCGVVTISDVSGLDLTAGQQYFLVIGPENPSGSSSLTWNANSQATIGLELYSTNGGGTWNSNGQQTLGAFDIVMQPPPSMTAANEFQVTVGGSVSQIDVAVGYVSGENSFIVEIAADNNGQPGTVLADFDRSSSQGFGGCCGLLSISGISGLNLSTGTNYWIVVGPTNPNTTTSEQWNLNYTGATGLDLFSLDFGATWNSRGQMALGAFDILGASGTLFSDLGTGENVYECCSGWPVYGSQSVEPTKLPTHVPIQ